ncbi:cytochrome P450 3A9 [Lepeophtheirus salmonis]|uniref:cytochrome P450 3A9 n=1 Tax=Lepeophtheirus salmonis TaxID=72036 RepID=UPI001AE42BAB|nr:cytochrome P450 3A9-like [Lepeophtheirus salmonis]
MMLLIISLVVIFSLIYFYLNRYHGYLENLPFPQEKPFLCFGSPPFFWHNYVHHFYYTEAFKRFKSQTFTRYTGSIPTISTIDPKIIKQVTIKQFNNFHMTFTENVKDKNKSLDISHGPLWKLLRKELTPVFTSGKLKGMMEPLLEITNDFLFHIESQTTSGKSIKIKQKFHGLTLDVINSCAYGIKTNSSQDSDHELLKHAKKLLEDAVVTKNLPTSMFILLLNLFPGMIKYIDIFGNAYEELIKIANSIIANRETENIKKKDFINVLVEMRKNNNECPNELLNNEIITAQAVIFFVAGYVTTSHSLCCLIYVLATNPEIQDQLYQEILSSEDQGFDEHSYTSAVIKEALRLYPPATMHTRVCTHDTEVEGIFIKNGTIIEMPIYASHYYPEFFPNPEEFKPERFFKENNSEIIPDTFRPFGDGNRICIAYRFAMMELQIVIEKLVKKFEVIPTHETKIVHSKGSMFILDFDDIGVQFKARE